MRSRGGADVGQVELLLLRSGDDRSGDDLHGQLVGWEPGMDTVGGEWC